MLGKKGAAGPLTLFRFKPRRNSLVELPANTEALLQKVTHCLITHLHPDHIDPDGIAFLKERKIPVVCSQLDQRKLKKKGLNIELALAYDKPERYLGGKLVGIQAIHGYGFVKKIAGNVMGFHLELPDDKSVYISSDTVYTDYVDQALKTYQPDITVMAAGMARLDIGDYLLMNQADLLKFVQNSPQRVLANHMEALNHCPHTREDLRQLLQKHGLQAKVDIPEDGEVVVY